MALVSRTAVAADIEGTVMVGGQNNRGPSRIFPIPTDYPPCQE